MKSPLHQNIPFKLELDKTVTRQALTTFQHKMWFAISEAQEKGKGYWWNNQICKLEELENLLGEALVEKDYISVANYAMMIDARKQMTEEYDAFFGSVYPDLAKQEELKQEQIQKAHEAVFFGSTEDSRKKEIEDWKETFKPENPDLDDLQKDGHD